MGKIRIFESLLKVFVTFVLLISSTGLLAMAVEVSSSASFQKLSDIYTVSYGNPNAPVHMTEYFSFSCPKCLEFMQRDFLVIQDAYIDTGNVYWTFHPDPADILTLQAMVCFEKLGEEEKRDFLEYLAQKIRSRSMRKACFKMQEKMEELGKPLPFLHDLSFLEKTEAFSSAYAYLKQPNVPDELPTVEVNGKIYQEFPNREWIQRTLIAFQDLTLRRSE